MSDSGQAPPGWYDDPENPGQLRYWDGGRWTDDRRPASPSPAGAAGGFDQTGSYAGGAAPSTWLWQSILSAFCCLPLGIVGIVFAAQAQSAVSVGNYGEAREKADKARLWTLIAFGAGILATLAWIGLIISAGSMSEFSEFQ